MSVKSCDTSSHNHPGLTGPLPNPESYFINVHRDKNIHMKVWNTNKNIDMLSDKYYLWIFKLTSYDDISHFDYSFGWCFTCWLFLWMMFCILMVSCDKVFHLDDSLILRCFIFWRLLMTIYNILSWNSWNWQPGPCFCFFFYSRDLQPCFLSVNNLKFYSWLKLQFSPEWSLTSFALNFKSTIQQGLRKRPNTHQSNPHNNIDFSTLKQRTARIPSKGLFCSILILNPFHIQAYSVYSFTSFAFPGKLREIPRIWQQQHNKGRKPTKTLEKSATNLLQVNDKSQAHFEDISKMFCLQNQMIIVYRLHWTLLSYVNRFIYFGRLGQNVTIWTHHNLNIPQSKHITT